MNRTEYDQIVEIINELKRRKYKLELQHAKFGANADPAIETQIEDLDEKIALQERKIYRSQQIAESYSPKTPFYLTPSWKMMTLIISMLVIIYALIDKSQKPTAISATSPFPTRIATPIKTTPTMPPFEAQSWDQDGFVLHLENEPTFYTDTIAIGWVIENKTEQDITIPINYYEGFYARDNLDNALEMNTIACYSNLSAITDCELMGTSLRAGYFIRFTQVLKLDSSKSRANTIIIKVLNIPKTLYREFSFPIKRFGN